MKQDYVARKVRLDNIRLGRETFIPDPRRVKKMEKIRKILKKYDRRSPMKTLDKLVANVKLL